MTQYTKISLSQAITKCSALQGALDELKENYALPEVDYSLQGHGLIFNSKQLPGLGLESSASYGMLLRLPDDFEEVIDKLVTSEKLTHTVMPTLDLQHMMNFIMLRAERFRALFLAEELLRVVLLNQPHSRKGQRPVNIKLPIILIAGKTVVTRIYSLDQNLYKNVITNDLCCGPNWNPQKHYSEADLEEGEQDKQLYGNMPWYGKKWSFPRVDIVDDSTKKGSVWMPIIDWFIEPNKNENNLYSKAKRGYPNVDFNEKEEKELKELLRLLEKHAPSGQLTHIQKESQVPLATGIVKTVH